MFSCLFSLICIVFVCIFYDLYWVFPYCLFVSNSQVIGCEDCLQNDLYCVGWGVKLYSVQSNYSSGALMLLVNGVGLHRIACFWSAQWFTGITFAILSYLRNSRNFPAHVLYKHCYRVFFIQFFYPITNYYCISCILTSFIKRTWYAMVRK